MDVLLLWHVNLLISFTQVEPKSFQTLPHDEKKSAALI